MRIGQVEVTAKRLFGPTPALLLAVAMWVYYSLALVLEYASSSRYSATPRGETHIWSAALAALLLIIFCGVFWKRSRFTRGSYSIGCILAGAFVAVTGWYIEQKFFHAGWNTEKSKAVLIYGGTTALLLIALFVTPALLAFTEEDRSAQKPMRLQFNHLLWQVPLAIVLGYGLLLSSPSREPLGLVDAFALSAHEGRDVLDFNNGHVLLRTCCGDESWGTYSNDDGKWIWHYRVLIRFKNGESKVVFSDEIEIRPHVFTMEFTRSADPHMNRTLRRRLFQRVRL